MPLPGNYSTRTVAGTILNLHNGLAAAGTIRFTPQLTNQFVFDGGADTIIAPTPTVAVLDVNGAFSVTLGTTDDPDINPNGWTYTVEIITSDSNSNGQHTVYSIQVPAGGGTLNLADIPPVASITQTFLFVKTVNGIVPDAAGNVTLVGLLTILNPNSTFETNVTGWEAVSGAVTRSTAQFHAGVASMLLTPTGGAASEARMDLTASGSPSVVVGQTYFAAGWVRSPTGFNTVVISIDWLDAASAVLSTTSSSTVDLAVDIWTYLAVTGVAPASAVKARVRFRETGTPAAGDLLYIDEAILTVGTSAVALADLIDVQGAPANLDVLNYNSGAAQWEPSSRLTTAETKIATAATTQVFTANGTWTKPANLRGIWVRAVAGGSSGGGCAATVAAEAAEGSGGGGGQYVEKYIPAASLGATETVSIGAGGAAAAAGGAGNSGGNTTFGAHLTANSGVSGGAGVNTTTTNIVGGGAGGTGAHTGTYAVDGQKGGNGRVIGGLAVKCADGGGTVLAPPAKSATLSTTGTAGILYGGGSSGASNGASQAAKAGTAAAAGICIVVGFY